MLFCLFVLSFFKIIFPLCSFVCSTQAEAAGKGSIGGASAVAYSGPEGHWGLLPGTQVGLSQLGYVHMRQSPSLGIRTCQLARVCVHVSVT